jgi:transcriptional regulator with XRE-family HTH domain
MDAKTYLEERGRDKAKEVAEAAGTSFEYFGQIASGRRRPSVKLALKLVEASGGELEFVALLTSNQQTEAA